MPRLFAAIRPSASVRDALIDTMEGVENARWQDEDQLHLTLRFMGEVGAREAEDLAAALEQLQAPPFTLEITGVGHFEHKRRVHALWAGIAPSPALAVLQRRVERACRSAGLPPERRRFTPHVTLARLNSSSGPIAGWLAQHAMLHSAPFEVREFILYESLMGQGGSHYEPLLRFPLRGGAEG
ncbi:RNA 2',3'-cyclic phosphodiesterase [Altererythrobacter sp. B11]|uniref:RNA 2',3'-cyclic phosphodiesterase n=1 Tax=Altererythrobacter sp. B11 TaxID=2060312 RepID=UPI000E5BB24C|nr:RNA 2',3'-cyclic phosphodiesterase [Altererythrobacter sp. B11]